MDVEFLKYQFEDGLASNGVAVKSKFKLGVRHIQLTYMIICAASLGALRGSTGVAVLSLTDVTRRNDTYIQIQKWDSEIQGIILSSFLFGYALMLVPAELFLRRVQGKHVLTVVLVVVGALTVAMPTIVIRGGWIAVCNAHLWLGAAQACLTPANQTLLIRFLPPSERHIFSFLVHSGSLLGILIGLPISGLLSEAPLGWELIFYSQAILTLSMACLWGLLTASTPDQHPAMGDSEKEFIREAMALHQKIALQVPWRYILTSRPLWSAAIAHIASNAVFVFFLFYVPAYLQTFGMSLKDSSWQMLFPFVTLWLLRVTTSPTIEWLFGVLRLNFQFNLTYLRKLFNFIGSCGVIAGLTVLPNLTPPWKNFALVTLAATLGMMGFQFSGFLESHKDMSENYHGTLMMVTRAVASIIGAFVPAVVGLILGDDLHDMKRWRSAFLCLASLYIACNAFYTAFGSSQRQNWDGIVVQKKFGYHNTMIDTNQLEMEELCETKKPNNDIDNANTTI